MLRINHHTSWDNHILTLSTASLGFIFAVLPLSKWCYINWAIAASITFGLSIFIAMFAFLMADMTFKGTSSNHTSRKQLLNTLEAELAHTNVLLEIEKENLGISEKGHEELKILEAASTTASDDYNRTVMVQNTIINKYSKIVNYLNSFKTLSFLAGLFLIGVYVFKNN